MQLRGKNTILSISKRGGGSFLAKNVPKTKKSDIPIWVYPGIKAPKYWSFSITFVFQPPDTTKVSSQVHMAHQINGNSLQITKKGVSGCVVHEIRE